MESIRATEGQTLFDISIQWLGSDEAAYTLGELNSLSVTESLIAGQVIYLSEVVNADIAVYFANRAVLPVTDASAPTPSEWPGEVPVTVITADTLSGAAVKASEGQTIFDLSVQWLGSDEAAFAIAELNSLSVTEMLGAGQLVYLPQVVNAKVVDYYSLRGLVPANDATTDGGDAELVNEGIDYWAIGIDFVVS